MNDTIPPLPDLEISGTTPMFIDQETIDRYLRTIYERRPDFFRRIAERDMRNEEGPNREFAREFTRFTYEVLHVTNLNVSTSIYRETRRRARLMYGLPI